MPSMTNRMCVCACVCVFFLFIHPHNPQAYAGKSGVFPSSQLTPAFATVWSTNVLRWEQELYASPISVYPVVADTITDAASSAGNTGTDTTAVGTDNITTTTSAISTDADASLDSDITTTMADDNSTSFAVSSGAGGMTDNEWTHSIFMDEHVMELWTRSQLEPLDKLTAGKEALDRVLLQTVRYTGDHSHINHSLNARATRAAWSTLTSLFNLMLPSTLCRQPPHTPSGSEYADGREKENHFGNYSGGAFTHPLTVDEAETEV